MIRKTHQVITNICVAKVRIGDGDSIRQVIASIQDDEVGGDLPQLALKDARVPAPPAQLALHDARVPESFEWAYTLS